VLPVDDGFLGREPRLSPSFKPGNGGADKLVPLGIASRILELGLARPSHLVGRTETDPER